jgi:hypothetical protein
MNGMATLSHKTFSQGKVHKIWTRVENYASSFFNNPIFANVLFLQENYFSLHWDKSASAY